MRCPKCQGCQIMSEERVDTLMLRQWRCLNCGRRSELGYVAVPLTVNPRRQWESEVCPRCQVRAAMRTHHLCRICQCQAIVVGMAQQRNVAVPLTVNPRRQWESELCPRCMTWAAVRKHHLCRSCQGQAIAVGLEKARRVG